MLRIGGDESPDIQADRCWNAAWDIWFLRLTEGDTLGLMPGLRGSTNGPTALLTRNVDPIFLRAASEVRGVVRMPGSPAVGDLVFAELDWSLHRRLKMEEIEDLLPSSPTPANLERAMRSPSRVATQARLVTQALEQRLGVTRSAFSGMDAD